MPSDAQRRHFEHQLAAHGKRSLERSRSSLGRRLEEHTRKLDEIRSLAGRTSYVEAEIRNYQAQIRAIDEILGAP